MTKQEEIIEGVILILQSVSLGELTEYEAIIKLHELGVVIKVWEISDDLAQTAFESPKYFAWGKGRALVSSESTFHIFKDFKDMGYVATMPLIEEEK